MILSSLLQFHMDKFKALKIYFYTCLFLIHFSSPFLSSEAQAVYRLPDQFFINCGSSSSVVIYGNRTFIGDGSSGNLTITPSTSNTVEDTANSSTIELYRSARLFRNPSEYELNIVENGTYVVRFHFFPFSSTLETLSDARFSVSASGISLLSDFSVGNSVNFPRIEEFLISITPGTFRVDFVPNGNSFAFVNAIEVFLAPPDLLRDYHNNGSWNALRVIHRINVGGDNITPQNDTLLRNWISDDPYLLNRELARNSTPFNGTLLYQVANVTEFDAPTFVYSTAKEMNISNSNSPSNITWRFDVRRGVMHLVRAHFCSILTQNFNLLAYNLSIDSDFSQDINPWNRGGSQYNVPFYIDILAISDDSGFMNISIGPPNDPRNGDSFINGVEIMELIAEPGGSGSGNGLRMVLIIVGSCVACLVLVLMGVIFFCLKRGKWKNAEVFDHWPLVSVFGGSTHSETLNQSISGSPLLDLNLGLKVSLSEINYATKGFDAKLVIGEGGFGKVYKGMLRNGRKVAVKRSEPGHGQGFSEFQAEVMLLSRIRHNHLVALVGYCDERNEMILVYEFMEKGTLREHLYTEGKIRESTSVSELSWVQRLQICIGAARGIHYLHTGQNGAIIHRDIKSTNILLDEHYVAKVADFGLSRLGPIEDSQETHVSTVVKGSFGYLDPEYLSCSELSLKSDVYSFGVVLLEVVCARSALDNTLPRDQINLADWGLSFQTKGQLEKIIDPFLVGKVNPDSLRKFGELVEKCLQGSGADRPYMADVLWDLEYCLQLQNAAGPRAPHEDSMIDASLELPMRVFERLPSDSITMSGYDLPDDSFNYSDASKVNASGVFSQLKIGEAR